MKGKLSPSENSSMASSSSSTTTTTTTTAMTAATLSTEDSETRRDSNSYFPDCRKDANCSCEICLQSLNATLDLMPLSVQKSSLTKLSYSSFNFNSTVESTPTSFDPTVVTTPASVSRPISNPIKKKLAQKPKDLDNEEPVKKTMKKERRSRRLMDCVALKLVLVILCLELGFRLGLKGMILNPKFTEEVVRMAGERSQAARDLGSKLKILENDLGKLSSCSGSNSDWRINLVGPMLNSKCVLYKSVIEEVSIWGWPLQTSGLFLTGFSSSSITVLSGRVTEWSEGRFSYSIHETNTSWEKLKWSTSVLQLDPNTWVLEYRESSVLDHTSFSSLTVDLITHMMYQAAKNLNRELFYSEAVSNDNTMTPT